MDTDRIRQLEKADANYLWHPYTQMSEYLEEDPVIIASANGAYLQDVHGRRYLDGVSSLWVNLHGHRHPVLDAAVKEQLAKLAHSTLLGVSNVPAIELAEALAGIAPRGLTKIFYSDNGSTAVEIALKMSYQYWQQSPGGKGKRRFVALKNGYHGDTLGCVGVGGLAVFHDLFKPLSFKAFLADSAYCYRCPVSKSWPSCQLACLASLEEILALHAQEVAALIMEPKVQAAGGMIVSPPGFLKRVRELCTRYHVHLIADEVAVGFGRTGTMFACQQEEVIPDFLCLAKGITGGYLPLAATLTRPEVFQAFLGDYGQFKALFHGHTYTGNPLACAVALANLDIFTEEQTLAEVQTRAPYLADQLEPLKELAHVGDIRQCGLMVGIELVGDKESKSVYPPADRIGHQVILQARSRGLIIRPLGEIIVLLPPLTIELAELKTMVEIVADSRQAVTGR
ncbi:MAG: adenosylmethionine--8-amino-7-oxononanoate transaminase [Dehalococcoidales bacterium]